MALRGLDGRLAQALEATTAGVSSIPEPAIDMEPMAAISAAIGALREPLSAALDALAAEEVSTRQGLDRVGDGQAAFGRASDAIKAAYGACPVRPEDELAAFVTGMERVLGRIRGAGDSDGSR